MYIPRQTSVLALIKDPENLSNEGTALFIAATLLQREAVETMVPVQAFGVIMLLYSVQVPSNSIVNGWGDAELVHAIQYIGIDLGVELIVFMSTVLLIHLIYPQFSTWRILRGLLKIHYMEMFLLTIACWSANLLYQTIYSGMDMTLRFQWWHCNLHNHTNSTWMGGFEWNC